MLYVLAPRTNAWGGWLWFNLAREPETSWCARKNARLQNCSRDSLMRTLLIYFESYSDYLWLFWSFKPFQTIIFCPVTVTLEGMEAWLLAGGQDMPLVPVPTLMMQRSAHQVGTLHVLLGSLERRSMYPLVASRRCIAGSADADQLLVFFLQCKHQQAIVGIFCICSMQIQERRHRPQLVSCSMQSVTAQSEVCKPSRGIFVLARNR